MYIQYSGSPMVAEHARRNLHFLLVQRPELEAGDYEKAIAKALQGEDGIKPSLVDFSSE